MQGECYVWIEAETGMMLIQAKEYQIWPEKSPESM